MKTKLLNRGPERTYAVVLETGEDPIECLTRFARDEKLDCARFTAIGAFANALLGFFDLQRKEYEQIAVDQQTEVLSIVGDIALGAAGGKPQLHAHAVLGKRDGSACGGHLIRASVRPTLEVMLVEAPSYLRRRTDSATGLALIDLSS
jgi:predicted DNA-binding protein with PD1-like motif